MSDDEEFGRALGARLQEEAAGLTAPPDLARTVRRRRRRTLTMRAAVGVPVVAAAAAATVLVTSTGPGVAPGGGTAAPTSTTQREVVNVAQVRSRTIEALQSVDDYVIYRKEESFTRESETLTGYTEEWRDLPGKRRRQDTYSNLHHPDARTERLPNGDVSVSVPAPAEDHEWGEGEMGEMRRTYSLATTGGVCHEAGIQVDYEARTWHEFDAGTPPEGCPNSEVPNVLDAEALRTALDDGTLKLIGSERVNGRDTHHIRLEYATRGYQLDMWVDAESYLPIKESSTVSEGPGQAEDSPVLTASYEWLPRTQENLNKVELTPPADFTER